MPTIASSLDARVVSALKAERVARVEAPARAAAGAVGSVDKKQLIDDVRARALRREDLLATRRG